MSISCIVTVHDNREGLDRLLAQIVAQTRQPDEVIIIASDTDTTGLEAVIDENRNDWGHEKRAKGLALAKSDYVCFMNADDEYAPEFIEEMMLDYDLVYCNFTSRLFKDVVVSKPVLGSITSGNFIVRTELAQRVGYNHRVYEADGLFIQDIMQAGASHHHVDKTLYFHH